MRELSNMRWFDIGQGNTKYERLILLDEGILSMRCLCDALLLDEGLFKHKALCYWMSKLTNIRYFAIRCRNSQT
jgi:hypothetical protein